MYGKTQFEKVVNLQQVRLNIVRKKTKTKTFFENLMNDH